MTIRELDDETVRRIAAGEVIERPASVVKELVENALDADAGRIDVAVESGGIDHVRVADDGVGMSREAVRTAVREHTTSKIDDADDLTALGTLGFRGEALHAIGAVSRLAIATRPRGGDRGTELVVERGEVTGVRPAGRPEGTTVAVSELFAETPARRKFLKEPATEFDHVNRIVTRYALANPDVAVSLSHDGREVFSTAGRGDLEAAILSVYGREVAEAMRPVEGEGVSGYVSHPETTRSTREYVSTFVNGRYVRSSTLRDAVLSAYGDQLAPDRYPFAVLFLDLPPGAVDVNVHPRKLEVRFDDPEAVGERIREAVETALIEEGLVRSGAPRGRSAPEEATVEPDPRDVPDADTAGDAEADASSGAGAGAPTGAAEGGESSPSPGDEGARIEATAQTTLGAGSDPPPEFASLPDLRVLGQVGETYVVAEAEDGLVLIDQHAADERVNYERLRERLADAPDVQALAEPATVELTAREAELFPAHREALEALGFRAERAGDTSVRVHAVPAVLGTALSPALLRDVLPELVRERDATSVEERADALLADLACHPSVTAGTSLSPGSVRALLAALDDCENPFACPHGRPTVVEIDRGELDERFERDYPGHPGRAG